MHNRKGKVSKFGEEWAFLGGGMEDGESPLMAAKREIKEEVGYTLDEHRDRLMFFKKYHEQFDSETEAEVYVYEAKFPGFQYLKDSEEVKLDELKLFTIDEGRALKNLLPVAKRILDDLEGSFFLPQTFDN